MKKRVEFGTNCTYNKGKPYEDDLEEYYNKYGWIYPILWGETVHWGFFKTKEESLEKAARQWSARTVELLIPREGGRYLDVGCGPCHTSGKLIREKKVMVDGLDISEYQLGRAVHDKSKLLRHGLLNLIKGDLVSAQLGTEFYDGAYSEAVFFQISEKRTAFRNLRRTMRSGARFVFDDLMSTQRIPEERLRSALDRFGIPKIEREQSYKGLLRDSGFEVLERISCSDDIARTYLRLLDRLESEYKKENPHFNKELVVSLTGSFRSFVELIWDGLLIGQIVVAEAA